MVLKCKVSSIEASGVRLILLDKENTVTTPVAAAAHVGLLEVGDIVTAVFFNNLTDGLIIAKFGG